MSLPLEKEDSNEINLFVQFNFQFLKMILDSFVFNFSYFIYNYNFDLNNKDYFLFKCIFPLKI